MERVTYLTVTFEHNFVVRARMVRKFSLENGGDSTNAAESVLIILPGARNPFAGLLDVDLARNMVVPEGLCWHDRYWVFLVIDSPHAVVKDSVHKARELLVTNPGHAVPDDSDVGVWGE